MRALWQDLRFAGRTLRKAPGYSIAALVVLALGIGANTSIFTVVNAVLLQPLPFGHPEQLVRIWHTPPQSSFPGQKIFSVSAANFLDWQKQNNVFQSMALATGQDLNLTGAGEPVNLQAATVTKEYFSTLEAKPLLGRTFTAEEDQPGKNHAIVLSYATWKTHFAGDRNLVGKQITLNREAYDVVGVMGPNFKFPSWAKGWTPMGMTPRQAVVRGEHHFSVVARLKPGVQVRQAQVEMDTISQRLAQQYPADDKGWGAVVIPLREALVGDVRPTLLILLGAVAFVLLIACANVANLTLVRTMARTKEIAIRTALGAGRRRVIQQVLAESVLLSLAGGGIGLALSLLGTKLVVKVLADELPQFYDVHLDLPVLAFTFGVAVLVGVLAGLLPAWGATRANPNEALKQGLGRTDSEGGRSRTRTVLVVTEVALSLVLLFGAGLMIRTLWALQAVKPGYDANNVLTLHLGIPAKKFSGPTEQAQFYDRLLERLRQLPGVQAASVITGLPTEGGSTQPIAIEGRPVVAMADQPEVAVRIISPEYLQTMRVPVIRGRDIVRADSAQAPDVVLISETMAKRFWPGEDPIGRHITLTFSPGQVREIVGIVGDVKQASPAEAGDDATLYFPLSQIKPETDAEWRSYGFSIAVRARSNVEALAPAASAAIHELDPEVPVIDVMSMGELLGTSIAQQRFTMILLETFAGLALLLAAVGIYSVLAYSVRRRMREIGLRMALGAQRTDVLRLVLLEGLRPTLIGVAIGIAAALAVSRLLASLVFGVKTTDMTTFSAATALLLAVGALASLLPGYRAMQVEPMKTLRDE
jgi:predicted permease